MEALMAQPCLVVCPRCQGCATVSLAEPGAVAGWHSPRRLTCPACGLLRRWTRERAEAALGRPVTDETLEPHFATAWWLQTPCRGEVLWACNAAHLRLLKEHVSATLRERRREEESGWANGSLASRLPRWMQRATHREDVLAGLARLEAKLAKAAAGEV